MPILDVEAMLTTTADTVIENTAKDRWVRLRVRNRDTVAREVNIKWGSLQVEKETLQAGESRTFGPESLLAANTLKAWMTSATVGSEMLVKASGEKDP